MKQYLLALVMLVALVMAPITVELSFVHALPPIPADAENVDQQVLGQCPSGKLMLLYIYKLKNGELMGTIKSPNGPVVAVMRYKADGTVYEVNVGDERLSPQEARARYGSGCGLLDSKRT